MTEDELRLFSKFLEQKEYGVFRDALDTAQFYVRSQGQESTDLENRMASGDFASHRMTGRYLVKNNDRIQQLHDAAINNQTNPQQYSGVRAYLSNKRQQLSNVGEMGRYGNTALDLQAGETALANSGYDSKYASKGMEVLMGRRLKDDDFKNIVDKRLAADKQYQNSGNIDTSTLVGKFKNAGQNIGRKWNDASIVYGEGTDGRSLGTDAAIAAGALAATGLAVHAIRKRKKKKQEQKEALNNKFKTSGE